MIKGIDLTGTGACAAFNLRKTARVVSQTFDAALRKSGLRSTQFTILVAVAKAQPVSIGALAQTTLLDATTMTRSLALLQTSDLVQIAARGRAREKQVRLSRKGEQALARCVPLWRKTQARFEQALGAREWRTLRLQLEHVARLNA
jgi:DNA-binding MarR family transcriptional regulator